MYYTRILDIRTGANTSHTRKFVEQLGYREKAL